MPRIVIKRTQLAPTHTLGELRVLDDIGSQLFRCFTLELPWLNNKPGESCIPAGEYHIELEYSPAFKRKLWELKDVPGRSEVKVHPANHTHQLRGCIAPALSLKDIDGDHITDGLNSAKAVEGIHKAMNGSTRSTITIS